MTDFLIAYDMKNGVKVEIGQGWTHVYRPGRYDVWGKVQDTPEYRKTAMDLGYGDDVDAMCQDHDPLHALIACIMGYDDSYALLDGAGKLPKADRKLAGGEERCVLTFQTVMRTRGITTPSMAVRLGVAKNLRTGGYR